MLQQSFKTIVVGVDFSDYSRLVVKQARLLCKLWNTKLVFVHVIHDPVVYSPAIYVSFPNLLTTENYERMIRKTYKLKSGTESVAVTRGVVSYEILQVAAQNPQPLIVAGYKGSNKIAEFFFGSTAQTLVLNSKYPVWIHRGAKVVDPKKVLIPHDLSLVGNRSIDILQNLSLATPLSYEVFFVKERPFPVLDYSLYAEMERRLLDKSTAKIRHLLKEYPKLPFVTAKGDVTTKVAKRAKKFDLLVMAHHNPTGLFSKSETVELLRKVKTPVLVVH